MEKNQEKQSSTAPEWRDQAKRQPGNELLKNLAVAASLVLCAVTLKSGALPGAESSTDALLAAVTTDSLLDDQLGKLSFVSTLFPEATLVFGEGRNETLTWPVSGSVVVHAWSEQEPYMVCSTDSRDVFAAAGGTVMGVYHGEDEERLVHVKADDGLVCAYGNLAETYVTTGDRIAAGTQVGELKLGQDLVFEVLVDGVRVDPSQYLNSVQ